MSMENVLVVTKEGSSIVQKDIELPDKTQKEKGLDIVKLKTVLKTKGIINDDSEVE